MGRYFKSLNTVLFLSFAAFGCSTFERKPDEAQPNVWSRTEMSSRRGSFFEADLQPGSPFCGFGLARCSFELYYFDGPRFHDRFRIRNVLYIPGGPGDVVDRENPPLDIFGISQKNVYFDVRGTGYSAIHESNAYDQFLRARNVVEDIEALRKKYFNECSKKEDPMETKCEQKRKPWDAIYAHSWGTIVAQMYAKMYPESVNALILSAPVSRVSGNTGAARRMMIVNNLLDIYGKHSTPVCSWPSDIPTTTDPSALSWTENFCFLKQTDLTDIKNRLESLLSDIEREYGSTAFVGSFYDKLIKDGSFKERYPYPAEFFRALRWLEWYGAGENKGFEFLREVKAKKMHAAFFLGYYLTLDVLPLPTNDKGERVFFTCNRDAPLLRLVKASDSAHDSDHQDKIVSIFCRKITSNERALDSEPKTEYSLRASSVFGVFDGIARWIFRLMEEEQRTDSDNCFKVQDLHDIAAGNLLADKTTAQEVVKKIGIIGLSSDEKICPWDPGKYKQKVPTLILSGASDPVTAGGQARYFYSNGLTPGKRAFVEFAGVGHQMSPQVKKESNESEEALIGKLLASYGTIISTFLTHANNVDDFLKSKDLKDNLDRLNARLWPED
jgi:pimeloyl-ACP methyl ester carboxylesterase